MAPVPSVKDIQIVRWRGRDLRELNPYGLYVVREAMNDDFLRRSFGKDHEDGNLYEGGEFIGSPHSLELKDEQWLSVVGAKLDIPSFLTGYAVESLIDHWDGYFFGPHNYYVYHHPGLDRFVFLVAGADSVLGRVRAPSLDPKVWLAKKFLQFPETRARLTATLKAIVAGMDAAAMEARASGITAAHAAGVHAIASSWGYGDVPGARPDACVDAAGDIALLCGVPRAL